MNAQEGIVPINVNGERHNQPYSDTGIIGTIRGWLIEKLAGNWVVIMNAKMIFIFKFSA